MYWPDFSAIRWAAADGSAAGTLYPASSLPDGAKAPSQVAIDPERNKVYWAELRSPVIGYANLDGSGGIGTITISGSCTGGGANGEGLAVDGAHNTLYVIGDSPGGNRIIAADLDGTDCRDLLPDPISNSLGLAVDSDAKRVYWGAYRDAKLGWVDLDDSSTGFLDTGSANVRHVGYPTIAKAPEAWGGSVSLGAGALTCDVTWRADDPGAKLFRAPASVTYSWSRNGSPIVGATQSTLRPRSAGTYRCTATGTNVAGSSALSVADDAHLSALRVTVPARRTLRVRSRIARLSVRLGLAGSVTALATAGGRTIATGAVTAPGARTVLLPMKLTAVGVQRMRRAGSKGLKVKVAVAGTEMFGLTTIKTLTLRLRR
jgi:hypothetical protein